jgi:hypothetical protein
MHGGVFMGRRGDALMGKFLAISLTTAASIVVAATAVHAQDDGTYRPSPIQQRVDASFSNIRVDTPLSAVRNRLREVRNASCVDEGECDWVDSTGVKHYFTGEGRNDNRTLLVKTVEASAFRGRPISAFGIGTARTQAQVLANVRRFLGREASLDCNGPVSGNVGPVECGVDLNPGWAQIGFTRQGQLQAVRFDAFQAV